MAAFNQRVRGRRSLIAVMLLLGTAWLPAARNQAPPVSAIVTSPQARENYLARATIWTDPGPLSPQDVLKGPTNPHGFDQSDVLTCSFAQPGAQLGGASRKFVCRTDDGQMLQVKYWDPARNEGNREVFSGVAATRLMWALGFHAVHAWPLNLRCRNCPADPMSGRGATADRDYIASTTDRPGSEGALILSSQNTDQGWSWRELEEATASLPPGPERTAQRTRFSALTLLGVFIQHGDRKPEQQRLYCAGPIDAAAGSIETPRARRPVLLERPGAMSCPEPAVVISDVGATLGGAGRTSSEVNAKMNLERWRERRLFEAHRPGEPCRARVTVSIAAGADGRGNPVIVEEGRRFLLERLQRLTTEHVRALFTAARADRLLDTSTRPASSEALIQRWLEAFNDKVQQIASEQCQPMS